MQTTCLHKSVSSPKDLQTEDPSCDTPLLPSVGKLWCLQHMGCPQSHTEWDLLQNPMSGLHIRSACLNPSLWPSSAGGLTVSMFQTTYDLRGSESQDGAGSRAISCEEAAAHPPQRNDWGQYPRQGRAGTNKSHLVPEGRTMAATGSFHKNNPRKEALSDHSTE